jgi:DNA-binding YbaB/EbfC family protein
MAKGYGGMNMGGMNMNNLMKQAQKMQRQMEELQAELETKKYEVTSGGGAVKIVINGKKIIEEIIISPDVVDPDDIEMLQDLILTSVNEAVRTAEDAANNEMGKITGGVGLPGGLF